jgi:hypothetical protein
MMDGIVPDSNTSDNPDAWSPESDFLSELESAADSVVNGAQGGALSFSRASGVSVAMEVDIANASSEGGVVQQFRGSVLLVNVAGFQFSVCGFSALISFLNYKIYTCSPLLSFDLHSMPAHDLASPLYVDAVYLFDMCRNNYVFALTRAHQSEQLLEVLALKFHCLSLFNPLCFSWPKALGGFRLDDEGKVYWLLSDGLNSSTVSDSVSNDGSVDAPAQGSEADSDVVATSRRGRAHKRETPHVESMVKRSLRINSQGYNHVMIPYLTSKPKTSTVKIASTPEVLQISEMQRIGVEECLIDPAALTVEKLTKQRDDQD